MPIALLVALAGSLGAAARYGVDYYAGQRMTPYHQVGATLLVNIAGALLLGLLVGLHPHDGRVRIVIGVGFLGAFTTFSTLAFQSYHYLDSAQYLRAVGLPVLSVLLGVAAVAVGVAVGHRVH
ncbi:MAG: fluoride exporter [Gaiellales bacterium]|jgi:CrcB protein|nr:fluoride exporter [Gaiellales bacterium]